MCCLAGIEGFNKVPPRLWWVGAFGGAAAGIVYLLSEEVLAALGGVPVDEPFRLFASVLLGQRAFGPDVTVTDAILTGTLVIVVGSTGFGLAFAWLVCRYPGLAATPGTLVIAGATFGGALWLLNFYVLGFLFWPWLTQTNPTIQLACATIGYGVSLGAFFALAGVHRPAELE